MVPHRKIKKAWLKVGEACLVAAASAILLWALIYAVPNCGPVVAHHEETTTEAMPSNVVDETHPPEDSIMAAAHAAPAPAGNWQSYQPFWLFFEIVHVARACVQSLKRARKVDNFANCR